jgi:hypothetical protein
MVVSSGHPSKKEISIPERLYSVRRQASRSGHFQDERLGVAKPAPFRGRVRGTPWSWVTVRARGNDPMGKGEATWRPVGSYAVEALRYMSVNEAFSQIERGTQTPMAVWLTVLGAKALKRQVAARVLEQAAGLALMELQSPRIGVRWLLPHPLSDHREFSQDVVLSPQLWQRQALTLSACFGLKSGRLWLCRNCERPFVRHENQPRQTRCDECRRIHRTAAGLRSSMRAMYQVIRRRLALRVHRGTLTPEQRTQEQKAALQDAWLVQQEKLTFGEWSARHDRKDRPGRKTLSKGVSDGGATKAS